MKLVKKMMAVWAIVLACVSCTKDDAGLSDSTLVGKWMAVEIKVEFLEDGKVVETVIDNCVNNSRMFQFNADGTGQDIEKDVDGSETYAIKSWVLMGDELILTYEDDYYNENYTVSYSGGFLYLIYAQTGGEDYDYDYRYTFKFAKK